MSGPIKKSPKLISEVPMFKRTMSGAATIILLCGGTFFITGNKSRMNKIQGHITFIGNSYQGAPALHEGKERFIVLENYPLPFELFVGKESGDFKPDIERIDELRTGDEISLYYNYEPQQGEAFNNSARLVERGGQVFYKESNMLRGLTIFCAVLGLAIGVWAIIFKRMGKIL